MAGPIVHHLRRETVHISGFTTANRKLAGGVTSSHVERSKPWHDACVRLMVAGQRGVGFGLVATDADLYRNLGQGQPTAPGPYLGAYGLAGVIDNYGGSRREIDEARAAGLLIEAAVGDLLELDGLLWLIDFARGDQQNLRLTLVSA